MEIVAVILGWLSLLFATIPIVVAPWVFGAWEQWWFWPLTTCIFASVFFFALRIVLCGTGMYNSSPPRQRLVWIVCASFVPFLLYAALRMWKSDVAMDAERSFLLFLTPFLLGTILVYDTTERCRTLLTVLITANLVCLALYGIINHYVTGSKQVMWLITEFKQYAGRATGTYYCPDHFSGLMELLIAMGLGTALGLTDARAIVPPLGNWARRVPAPWQRRAVISVLAAIMIVLGLWGVWLSQSRGGMLTVVVMLLTATVCATHRLRPGIRWGIRAAIPIALILAGALFLSGNTKLAVRFKSFVGWKRAKDKPFVEMKVEMAKAIRKSTRFNMYDGALRAWCEKPWFGIGAGMHQHLWRHFAASPDGDRERRILPSRLNAHFHSYEVHNDWLQLLQEYGIIGVLLFIVPCYAVIACLVFGLRTARPHPTILAATISFACMAFHSLGDFNLQIPATTWIFGAILALGLAQACQEISTPRPPAHVPNTQTPSGHAH